MIYLLKYFKIFLKCFYWFICFNNLRGIGDGDWGLGIGPNPHPPSVQYIKYLYKYK